LEDDQLILKLNVHLLTGRITERPSTWQHFVDGIVAAQLVTGSKGGARCQHRNEGYEEFFDGIHLLQFVFLLKNLPAKVAFSCGKAKK
jgi:hypothetical protein